MLRLTAWICISENRHECEGPYHILFPRRAPNITLAQRYPIFVSVLRAARQIRELLFDHMSERLSADIARTENSYARVREGTDHWVGRSVIYELQCSVATYRLHLLIVTDGLQCAHVT